MALKLRSADVARLGAALRSHSAFSLPLSSASNGTIPPGGTTGQVLTKNSNADFDVGWATPAAPPAPAYGSGNPNGAVVAPPGSTYVDVTNPATPELWLKTSGLGNTGWVRVL